MNTQTDLRIRNRAILILLLPVTIFLFAAGWLLYCLGDRNYTRAPQRKQTAAQTNEIQIQIATAEEPEEINDQPA
jgi:CHASE3 domain sensor protein